MLIPSHHHTSPYPFQNINVKVNKHEYKRELTVQWTATAAKVKGHWPYFLFVVPIEPDNMSRFHYAQMYSLGARIFERLVNSDQRAQFQKFTEPPGGVWSNFFLDPIDTLSSATTEWNIMALCKKVWKNIIWRAKDRYFPKNDYLLHVTLTFDPRGQRSYFFLVVLNEP